MGEENVVTFETRYLLGVMLRNNGESEKAIKVYEKCLSVQMKVLGEDHKLTLMTLMSLGLAYDSLGNYEKASEYYERGSEAEEEVVGEKSSEYTLHRGEYRDYL